MGRITSEWILETGKSQSNISDLTRSIEAYNTTIQRAGEVGKDVFRESAKSTQDFNRQLADGTRSLQKIATSTDNFEKELKGVNTALKDAAKSQKALTSEAKYEQTQQQIRGVKNRIAELKGEFDETGKKANGLDDTFKRVGAGMAAYFSIGALVSIGKQIFDVTAEFQKFEAVLTTALGSGTAAERAMLTIQDFAAKTPFSVAELTDSYVKLANRGVRPTVAELTALGDLASSTGKSFDQLTEAALDALSGENERLKEFGITAQKTGSTTQFTFKGVTTEVENSDEAIKKYLISLGQVEGVSGSMAAISETLTGQVSNLGDSLDQLFLTIGSSNSGVMSNFISFLNDAIQGITTLIASTDQLGKNFSAASVNKYAEETKARFTEIAANATKNGQDVAAALASQGEAMQKDLEAKLAKTEIALEKFREERSTLEELADISGRTRLVNKSTEAGLASLVAQYKGQIAAISDVQKEILKPKPEKFDKEADKAAKEAEKKAAAAKKKALADLERELERLEKEAGKARLDLLNKNSQEYQTELYAQRTKEIDIMEDTIKKLEKLAGKDGILNPEQVEQINLLREQALREYQENVYNIELEARKKILDLQADSDAKEIAQITLRYDTEIAAAHRAKDRVLAAELEKAKARELAVTRFKQANANLDAEEDLAFEVAVAYKVDNTQTDSIKLERDKQQAILDVQIEFAQKRMNLLQFETGAEATTRRLALANAIKDLQANKAQLDKEQKRADFDMLALLGVDEDKRADVRAGLETVHGFVAEFAARNLEVANEVLAARQAEVEERKADLATEIDLNKQGFASDVETKRAALEESKKQRAEALKEQQRAIKLQQAMDAVSQVSSLITAGTTIFNATAALNIVPGLGIAIAVGLIGAMMAAIGSLKGKANATTKAEKGWDYVGGKRHREGGNKYVSIDNHNDVLEIEEGERIVNRQSNKKYWSWLNAINEDDQNKLANLSLQFLLQDTGVVPAKDLPKELERKVETYHSIKNNNGNELLLKELQSLRREVSEFKQQAAVKEHTQFLPDGTRIEKKGLYTRITHRN